MLALIESKKGRVLVSVFLSIVTSFCVQYAIPSDSRLFYTISAAPLLVGAVLFVVYQKALHNVRQEFAEDKAGLVLTSVLGLVFSSCLIEGAQLEEGVFFNPVAPHLVLSIAFCALPITFLLLLAWRVLGSRCARRFSEPAGLKWAVAVFFILLLCWLPWYLGSFPGLFCYNMGVSNGEWGQYVSGNLTTHFPVFHTLLSGFVVDVGRNVFGEGVDVNPGIALLTFFQCVIIACIFSYCVCWMRKRGASRTLVYGSLVYFALNPVIAMFVMCTTRDTLFSAVALLVAVFAYDALRDTSRTEMSFATLAGLAVSCIFLCLLRNNGIYSFVLLAIVLVALAKRRASVAVACVSVLTFALLWFGPAYGHLGVDGEANQQKEALALPIQQLAYVSSAGKLTQAETDMLQNAGYVMPEEGDYFPNISDPSKYTILDMSPDELARVYLAVGANHPVDFLYAELARTQDLWNPYSKVDCYNGFIDQVAGKETSFFSITVNNPGYHQPLLPGIWEFMHKVGGELTLQRIPFVSLLVSLPFYFAVLLVVLSSAVISRNRKLIGSTFVFVSLAVVAYFAPCVLPRYFMYLFFGLPMLLFLLKESCSQIGGRELKSLR